MVFLALLLTGGALYCLPCRGAAASGVSLMWPSRNNTPEAPKRSSWFSPWCSLGPVYDHTLRLLWALLQRALRKSTLIALAALFGVGASGIALAVAVPAVTGRWRPFPSNVSTAQNSRRDKPALGAFER